MSGPYLAAPQPYGNPQLASNQPINPFETMQGDDVSLIDGRNFYENAVTPDSLFLYLSTRLERLDTDITTIFEKQKNAEEVRKSLQNIKTTLTEFPRNDDNVSEELKFESSTAFDKVQSEIEKLEKLDPKLAERLKTELTKDGAVFDKDFQTHNTLQLNAAMERVDGFMKELEASAQLDMIQLQSLMSARQTAIQLATNLTATLQDSLKTIVGNMGR